MERQETKRIIRQILKQYGVLFIFILYSIWRVLSGDDPITFWRIVGNTVIAVMIYGIFVWGYKNEDSKWKK